MRFDVYDIKFPAYCSELQAKEIVTNYLKQFSGNFDVCVYYDDFYRIANVDIIFENEEDLVFWKLRHGHKFNEMD